MTTETIEKEFKAKVCEQIRLSSEGMNRFRVFTPFLFGDGDHLVIALKHEGNNWTLTDEGHTYMHLTYEMDERDFLRGSRQLIINNTLSVFQVEDCEGELTLRIRDDSYGDALYSFIQALLKITDLSFLSRDRVHSTFMEDFHNFIEEKIPKNRYTFEWYDLKKDPKKAYTVDCKINGMARPLFVYALPNDDRTRDATIAMLHFERLGMPFRTLAIFEDQESINRKVLARFSDVCEKQFSSLGSNRSRIAGYLDEILQQK